MRGCGGVEDVEAGPVCVASGSGEGGVGVPEEGGGVGEIAGGVLS